MTRTWIPAGVAGLLLSVAACTPGSGGGNSVGPGAGPGTTLTTANDSACPAAEPVGQEETVQCPQNGLSCHYESGPCLLAYDCVIGGPQFVWRYGQGTCSPAAVPGYSAQNGQECAFVGDVYHAYGNCVTTATCEPGHTWSVMTSLGPDNKPCP